MRKKFRGKIEQLIFESNEIKMESSKYASLVNYICFKTYPENYSKQEKLVLRRSSKNYEFEEQSKILFYLDKNPKNGSIQRRMVEREEEKERVFNECHSSNYAGHAGRDNTVQKIKERYYWPNYYKETVEMVNTIQNLLCRIIQAF